MEGRGSRCVGDRPQRTPGKPFRPGLNHKGTKDTKDTKKIVRSPGDDPRKSLEFFVSFVLFVSFVPLW